MVMHGHRNTRRDNSTPGFTLIELLVVISIVAILGGITLASIDGMRQRALGSRARGEIAVLGQGLENYRHSYGDYPWRTDADSTGSQELYQALVGEIGPKGDSLHVDHGELVKHPRFIDLAQFTIGPNHQILDPWGRPYYYRYKSSQSGTWNRAGVLLLSLGTNAEHPAALPMDGVLDSQYKSTGDAYDDIIYNE